MAIKLTRKWKNEPYSLHSRARWKDVGLMCEGVIFSANRWRGKAYLHIGKFNHRFMRVGPVRKSVARARRDAERLAVELLLDISDGVNDLLKRHGVNTRE